MKFVPRPYQKDAIQFLLDTPRAGLFLDVGMGKSSCAATVAHATVLSQEVKHWLIVAPLKVCQTTWPSEIKKWDMFKDLTVMFLHDLSATERKRRVQCAPPDVTVINVDHLSWLVEHYKSKWPYDGVILDESSKYKDSNTKRFRRLRKVLHKTTRVIELTGSPAAQGLLGLWAQIFLLDYGDALGRTFGSYKAEFFESDYHGYKFTPVAGAQERIQDAIRHLCMTMLAVDHLALPGTNYNVIEVPLGKDATDTYDSMEAHAVLELGDDVITAVNAGVLTGKLCQLANGAVYLSKERPGEYRVIHNAKLNALRDFVDEMSGKPFLLAYYFKSDKARLAHTFPKEIEFFDGSPAQLARWNAGKIPVLAIQPASAGHGVDGLQHGSNVVMWFSPPWSREQYDQFNGRVAGARQIGTQFEHSPATVHHLVARGTVDETAMAVLLERGATQESFLEALKRRIGRT